MTVVIAGESYECTKAVKGPNFVHLYQGDRVILSCLEITDFSVYVLTDGEWSDPDPDLDVIADSAELSGGSIVITSKKIIGTGTLLKFKAPCDCTAVTGGLVIDEKTYAIVDALRKSVIGAKGTWASGAQVSVLIDKANLFAFIQNRASSSVDATSVVLSTTWTEQADETFAQTISVDGVSEDNEQAIAVDVALSGTDIDADVAVLEAWGCVNRCDQGDGKLTFVCYGDKPTVAIPLNVVVM